MSLIVTHTHSFFNHRHFPPTFRLRQPSLFSSRRRYASLGHFFSSRFSFRRRRASLRRSCLPPPVSLCGFEKRSFCPFLFFLEALRVDDGSPAFPSPLRTIQVRQPCSPLPPIRRSQLLPPSDPPRCFFSPATAAATAVSEPEPASPPRARLPGTRRGRWPPLFALPSPP